jgi:hypothetical protein
MIKLTDLKANYIAELLNYLISFFTYFLHINIWEKYLRELIFVKSHS